MTKIFAHRGSSGTHPENTFPAFMEAERVGADGIELDVQLTKDNKLVVIHDHTVNRTTNGTGNVRDYTLNELKQLDAGSWFKGDCHDAKIPTLQEVLTWMQHNTLFLNIELKNVTLELPNLEELILKEIERYNLAHRVIISGFNHYSLRKIHELNPDIECAILYLEKLFKPWDYAAIIGARGLHPHSPKTDRAMITEAEQKGFPVRVYTVNQEERMKQLIEYGCSAIITDYPGKALNVRKMVHKR
ncbi:glycerophosphodiester phosphodiesterase [Virgibacillus oceani]|nr:glycerophosphodiester phosphodiesterase [Virgibacillus oceani]